ncbi:MAG TPA: HAMP domain-containing sensor histidine kinase [Polyangiaceae bacterium]|jgi:signal transduction histidine kinase
MAGALALVTGVAWWDEQREETAALLDLEAEQATLAESLAGNLRAHLASVPPDLARTHPASLLEGEPGIERQDDLAVLLSIPGQADFVATLDGRLVSSAPLRRAFDRGATTWRLGRAESADVGLPARTSMAGFARIDAGPRGLWGVVAVASAARERDREKRAERRLVLSVLIAAGLVLAFGGAAVRKQRKELDLARELAIAHLQRVRDEALARAARIATTGTFAMGIAHEVSTPLGVISGRAEQLLGLAQVEDRAGRLEKNARIILEQAHSIEQTIRRFLDMARGGPPSLEPADPVEVAAAAAAAVAHRFAKAGVALTAPTAFGAASARVRLDRSLLEHALVNLLLNACEACGPGGHVDLTVRATEDRVAFVVVDDGAGISPEHAARAAEPFFTTKPEGRGTGLGLAIASEIAKVHRGALSIGPRDGRGTQASIEVPAF